MSALLEIADLDIAIDDRILCRELTLSVHAGERWAVLGRNGAGKSTLLRHLAGLHSPAGGMIKVDGVDLQSLGPRERAQRVALLLQQSSSGIGATVWETVMTGRYPFLKPLQRESAYDATVVEQVLRNLDLLALASRPLDALSGGELRRVELARLLAQQAPLSLLDEPLNHLDPAHQVRSLGQVLGECANAERATIIVAHDLNLAFQACEQWLVLYGDGRWEKGSRDTVADPERLSQVFGHRIERLQTAQGTFFTSRFVVPATLTGKLD